MKLKKLTILAMFIAFGTYVQADNIFYNDAKLVNEIKILDTKYNQIKKKNKILKRSFYNTRNQNKKLSKEFGVFKKTTLIKIKKIEQKSLTNNTHLIEKLKLLKALLYDSKMQYEILQKNFIVFEDTASKKITNLEQAISLNTKDMKNIASVLGKKIENTDKTTSELGSSLDNTHKQAIVLSEKVKNTDQVIDQNMLYWMIAIVIVLLLVLVVFILLRKQIFTHKNSLEDNLESTRQALEEEGLKLDNKLVEILESQLTIISNSANKSNTAEDHTLALKVADEIIRIQKNFTRMDEKTKGLKQLVASVTRIQDNFSANGYELVDMLGKEYSNGMKVSVDFVIDEDLEDGQQIITRIIKPQVNYKGVMIQSAQIEVSQA